MCQTSGHSRHPKALVNLNTRNVGTLHCVYSAQCFPLPWLNLAARCDGEVAKFEVRIWLRRTRSRSPGPVALEARLFRRAQSMHNEFGIIQIPHTACYHRAASRALLDAFPQVMCRHFYAEITTLVMSTEMEFASPFSAIQASLTLPPCGYSLDQVSVRHTTKQIPNFLNNGIFLNI